MFGLPPPRHISTLPHPASPGQRLARRMLLSNWTCWPARVASGSGQLRTSLSRTEIEAKQNQDNGGNKGQFISGTLWYQQNACIRSDRRNR
jgi:hypothetical protein